MRDELLKEHRNKWVVVSAQTVKGFYTSYSNAVQAKDTGTSNRWYRQRLILYNHQRTLTLLLELAMRIGTAKYYCFSAALTFTPEEPHRVGPFDAPAPYSFAFNDNWSRETNAH